MHESYAKINNACLVTLTILALTGALIYVRPIMVPFVFSLFIFAALTPLLDWFQLRLKLNRWLAISLTGLLFASLSLLIFLLISISFGNFLDSANDYKAQVEIWLMQLLEFLKSKNMPIDIDSIIGKAENLPFFTVAKSVTGSLFGFFGNFVLISIFVIFFLAGQNLADKNSLAKEVKANVSKYVNIKLLCSLITGISFSVILFSFQVDLALMFGVLAFLLNFIPNIGSIVATILPLPILLLQFGFSGSFAAVLILLGAVQFFVGNILEPKWMGNSLNLHPITVLFFLLFWGLIWGIPGMFLSVPITAFIKIVFSRIKTTQSLADLLEGKLPQR